MHVGPVRRTLPRGKDAQGQSCRFRIERFFGLCASRAASAATYSASVPCNPPTPPTIPKTSSSRANPLTLEPTCSTVPAISRPSTAGSGCLACAALAARIFVSSGLHPARRDPDPTSFARAQAQARSVSRTPHPALPRAKLSAPSLPPVDRCRDPKAHPYLSSSDVQAPTAPGIDRYTVPTRPTLQKSRHRQSAEYADLKYLVRILCTLLTGEGDTPQGAGIGLHRPTRLDQDTREIRRAKRITIEVDHEPRDGRDADRTAKLTAAPPEPEAPPSSSKTSKATPARTS